MGLFVRNAGGGQVSFSEERKGKREGKREHPTQSDIFTPRSMSANVRQVELLLSSHHLTRLE